MKQILRERKNQVALEGINPSFELMPMNKEDKGKNTHKMCRQDEW